MQVQAASNLRVKVPQGQAIQSSRTAIRGVAVRSTGGSKRTSNLVKLTTKCVGGVQYPEGHQNSKWPTGVPPQMGGHLMPSGEYAPLSQSTTSGTGSPHMFQYHEDNTDVTVKVFPNVFNAGEGLAQLIADASAAAIKERGVFTIALSGPESSKALASLGSAVRGVDFANWHVYFAGEKCVPHTSDLSNFKAAKDAFLSKVPIPAQQVYAIEEQLPAVKAATLYEAKMRYMPATVPRNGPYPVLDFIVLDIGQRGDVGSLYPNKTSLVSSTACVVAVPDAPEQPAERISFSMPLINAAANVAMVSFGTENSGLVSRVLECQALPGACPAQMVRPNGNLAWFLDEASASDLSVGEWTDWKKWPRSEVPKPEKAKK